MTCPSISTWWESLPRILASPLRFYGALGLEVPAPAEGEDHVETSSGGMRIAWDSVELIKGMLGEWEEPKGNRLELAFKCGSEAEVDAGISAGGCRRIQALSWSVGRVLGTALRHSRGPGRQPREPVRLQVMRLPRRVLRTGGSGSPGQSREMDGRRAEPGRRRLLPVTSATGLASVAGYVTIATLSIVHLHEVSRAGRNGLRHSASLG